MIITVDTNVFYSALDSSEGASHLILKLIINEEIQFAVSQSTYFEYYDVLTRPDNLNKFIGSNFDDFLEEEGMLAEVEANAIKRVIAFQISELMK